MTAAARPGTPRWRRDASGWELLFCQAVLPYISRHGMEVTRHEAACVLGAGHGGDHLTYLPGDGGKPRAFPRSVPS